jgi:adenine-specific DNA-methyltransferase
MAKSLKIETLTHDEATRKNAPTAELEAFVPPEVKRPILAAYERRNPDLDPQLVWRGKDVADWSDLVVNAPPLYIQEKIHPKAIIEGLRRYRSSPARGGGARSATEGAPSTTGSAGGPPPRSGEEHEQIDLFADFNGIDPEARTEFYAHDQHWSNRMILGDALQVMASLAEREGLKGQVQCIYIDPPYGIKFNSNFQWSTTSRDVKDGKADHFSREPEQVKAFRDTWADGIHSYLTYLRDRLTVARDLLTESGSIFVQIGDENVHRVRALMDEVFGDENFVREITFAKTSTGSGDYLPAVSDILLWFARSKPALKVRNLVAEKAVGGAGGTAFTSAINENGERRALTESEKADPSSLPPGWRVSGTGDLTSSRPPGSFPVPFEGKTYHPGRRFWSTGEIGMSRLIKSRRVVASRNGLSFQRYLDDYLVYPLTNIWTDTVGQSQFGGDKLYVVQTGLKVVQRCILMTTDPGDLVLDPTCGSGTTAYVAEQWGRRWITIDTSRVALALARARIMGARYPWYLLADSREGQMKEAEITRSVPRDTPTHGRLR